MEDGPPDDGGLDVRLIIVIVDNACAHGGGGVLRLGFA